MRITKIKMPLLTSLSVMWLVLVGIYFVVGGAFSTFAQIILPSYGTTWSNILTSALLWFGLALFGCFIPIILIYRRKLLSWKIAVILLMTGQIIALILSLAFSDPSCLLLLAILFVPFLLLILDQKKYYTILAIEKLAKNKGTTITIDT